MKLAAIAATPMPPARPTLRVGEMDLWRVALDEVEDKLVGRLWTTLAADERARADKFVFDRDRRRFVVGRGALRALLGSYLDCAPDRVGFRYGTNGKPSLASPAMDVHFNVSHSAELALFAFTRNGPIGVDVERIRDLPDWESIVQTCFTPAEQLAIRARPIAERQAEFFRAWTRQEALLKAAGVGLGGDRPATAEFHLYELLAGDDFAASVAVPPGVEWANCATWRPASDIFQQPSSSGSQLRFPDPLEFL